MVEIQITGVRYDVSDKVKQFVQEKLGSLERFNSGLRKLHVTIHHAEKHGFRVDVDMHLPHGQDIVAHDAEDTVYSAIDIVTNKCAVQLRKRHERQSPRRNSDRQDVQV
jgi:ribosomal subunit interface protein